MHQSLQPILDLLDEGLRLYRRNVVGFLLLSASWFVPMIIAFGLTFAAARYLGPGVTAALILLWLLLSLPLAIYLLAGLSRAALAALEGRPVRPLEALAVHPLRLLGMSVFAVVFCFMGNMLTSSLLLCVICPLYGIALALFGGVGGNLGNGLATAAVAAVFGALLVLALVLLYAAGLMFSGATFAGLTYGIQSFTQGDLPFGAALQRSIDLISYRFGRNLLAFMVASLIFSALTLSVTLAVGVLLPLPLVLALGSDSPWTQGLSACAWLLGLMAALPPLPIWMALLFRRNLRQREGAELWERIAIYNAE